MRPTKLKIESKRIILRPINLKDNRAIFNYRSDAKTNQYQAFVPQTLQEVDAFITKNPAEFNQPETWFQLVIIEKNSHKLVGDLGIHFMGNDGFQCELGCTLSKTQQGQGFATEAMTLAIDYLFEVLNKHRIICSVDPDNTDSVRLLKRLNFRKEAHFKKSFLNDGKWVDDCIYALLNNEWKHRKNNT